MDFQAFNRFQNSFYTSISEFNKYTDFEIRSMSYLLLNNIIKGNPDLAFNIMNIYSDNVKALQSPAIIKALQHKFINGFSRSKVPQYIYFKDQSKSNKSTKTNKSEVKLIEVDSDVKQYICNLMMIDNKTLEYLLIRKDKKILDIIKEFKKDK